MRLDEFHHAIRAARDVLTQQGGSGALVVMGSQSILAAFPPAALDSRLLMSAEVDVMPVAGKRTRSSVCRTTSTAHSGRTRTSKRRTVSTSMASPSRRRSCPTAGWTVSYPRSIPPPGQLGGVSILMTLPSRSSSPGDRRTWTSLQSWWKRGWWTPWSSETACCSSRTIDVDLLSPASTRCHREACRKPTVLPGADVVNTRSVIAGQRWTSRHLRTSFGRCSPPTEPVERVRHARPANPSPLTY